MTWSYFVDHPQALTPGQHFLPANAWCFHFFPLIFGGYCNGHHGSARAPEESHKFPVPPNRGGSLETLLESAAPHGKASELRWQNEDLSGCFGDLVVSSADQLLL